MKNIKLILITLIVFFLCGTIIILTIYINGCENDRINDVIPTFGINIPTTDYNAEIDTNLELIDKIEEKLDEIDTNIEKIGAEL